VPLHEHLIEQGLLAFVKANGKGPLFYNEPPATGAIGRSDQSPQAALCEGTRERGRMGPEPRRQRSGVVIHHAWRHTFKAVGFRCGISEKVLDAIVGHAPASVGRGYGEPTLADKAQELCKFPRYRIS
jgi:hypothetical protein